MNPVLYWSLIVVAIIGGLVLARWVLAMLFCAFAWLVVVLASMWTTREPRRRR